MRQASKRIPESACWLIVAPLRSNDETSEQAHTGERNADTALAQKASRGRSRMPSGFENTW